WSAPRRRTGPARAGTRAGREWWSSWVSPVWSGSSAAGPGHGPAGRGRGPRGEAVAAGRAARPMPTQGGWRDAVPRVGRLRPAVRGRHPVDRHGARVVQDRLAIRGDAREASQHKLLRVELRHLRYFLAVADC